jgi:tRNA(Ile)-lysidine synthase
VADSEHSLREKLVAHCRRHALLRAGDRVGVAVSGGADSVALLRLLLEMKGELGLLLSVVHFHHQIRGAAAEADAEFVRALAQEFGLPFHLGAEDVPQRARERHMSLEAAARQFRYAYFRQLMAAGEISKVATAHTRDDQAETVLLRLLRGAGTRGLAGILPRVRATGGAAGREAAAGVEEASSAAPEIVRPLLTVTRREVERYLGQIGQAWCEDASNQDLRHMRNRVRHRLLPLLEQEFNPAIRQVLADTAEIARAEEIGWEQALAAVPALWLNSGSADAAVDLERLRDCPLALRRRALRQWLERHGIAADAGAIEALLELAERPNGSRLELPGGWLAWRAAQELPADEGTEPARRRGERLADGRWRVPVLRLQAAAQAEAGDFSYRFPVPGAVSVPELGVIIAATVIPLTADAEGYNGKVLSVCHLGEEFEVRNWRPGDRFQPGSAHSAHKVKELLQSRRVSGPERSAWPVIVNAAGKLLWMRGFSVPDVFAPAPDAAAGILIEERGWQRPQQL